MCMYICMYIYAVNVWESRNADAPDLKHGDALNLYINHM